MINFPILTFHGTRLKFWDAGMSPAKGEKRKQRKRGEKQKTRNLIRWLHVISSCQIHALRCSLSYSLQLSHFTKPNHPVFIFGLLYLGVNQNKQSNRNLKTWIFIDNPYGRMSTYLTNLIARKETRM
jgi:hypothetical protein